MRESFDIILTLIKKEGNCVNKNNRTIIFSDQQLYSEQSRNFVEVMDKAINSLLIEWLGESIKGSFQNLYKPSRIYVYKSFEGTLWRKCGYPGTQEQENNYFHR